MIKINNKTFYMSTKNTTYIISADNEINQLETIYYGKKIDFRDSLNDIAQHIERPSFASHIDKHVNLSKSSILQEFSTLGFSDYRHSTVDLEVGNDSLTHFEYTGYKIESYKSTSLSELPFAHSGSKTLVIIMEDKIKKIVAHLKYTPFHDANIIVKNLFIINNNKNEIILNKVLSSSMDLLKSDYDLISLDGSWGRERFVNNSYISNNTFRISSREGVSSSTHHPFLGIKEKNSTEHSGNVFGITLMYSSNFEINYEVNQYKSARVSIGINTDTFKWKLKYKEIFETPQAILTFSSKGLNGMSQNFHNFVKNHVSPTKWSFKERPVLLNNWEATYFDFNEEKIMNLVEVGKELGVELFCLDDGWFGKRNDDKSSLGDWKVNKDKLPSGINGLAKKINEKGLKFGIWIEPEMISINSDLYRKHPEFAIHDNRYPMVLGRNQLVLDMSNQKVIEYLLENLTELLQSSNIAYVKWDMNRPFSHSPYKGYEHKYVLGFYKLLKKLTSRFPDILFEGCASGGSRFDMGVLKYFPQIWTSDNTDAYERMKIQYGTSLIYPLNVMSNHVSDVPNHQVQRVTSLQTRMDVSSMGIMGYESNLLKATNIQKNQIKENIKNYKKVRNHILNGDFFRLKSPFEDNFSSFYIVSPDQEFAMGIIFKALTIVNPSLESIKLYGLNDKTNYSLSLNNFTLPGLELKNIGIFAPQSMFVCDFQSQLFKLKKKS